MRQSKEKLEIRESRIFSETLKKQIVKNLVNKRMTLSQVVVEHQVSRTSVYRWLYKYSPVHAQKCTLVVQMKSEEQTKHELQQKVAELERIVGQKQLEIDFLNKLLEVGSKELGFDLKKSFSFPPSSGTGITNTGTPTG
jgi:transposase-like protein